MNFTIEDVLNEFRKQSDIMLEILNDKRISDDVKNEYVKKYNELRIKDYSKKEGI